VIYIFISVHRAVDSVRLIGLAPKSCRRWHSTSGGVMTPAAYLPKPIYTSSRTNARPCPYVGTHSPALRCRFPGWLSRWRWRWHCLPAASVSA